MSLQKAINQISIQAAKYGIKEVFISPGSRNAPLILAFNRNPNFRCYSVADERSAGFMALGAAIAAKRPVALICTSGTACLNYYPAITEAYYRNVPLIIFTADRPPELIDQWDGQCIRQKNVFTNHVAGYFETPVDLDQENAVSTVGLIAEKALNCLNEKQQPVHFNVPMREPLYQAKNEDFESHRNLEGIMALGEPKMNVSSTNEMPSELINDLNQSQRILWVNGASDNKADMSFPAVAVLNDVVSNKHTQNGVQNWDALFMALSPEQKKSVKPDLLITTGTSIVSKHLREWLRSCENVRQWHVGNQTLVGDPFFKKPKVWRTEEADGLKQLGKLFDSKPSEYLRTWLSLDARYLSESEKLDWYSWNDLTACKCLFEAIRDRGNIHFANSGPVRYASWLGFSSKNIHVNANRGTSGIDGCTSTAVGYSMITNETTFLVTGDVAFFYDVNALWNDYLSPKFKIILLNNSGGGIFKLIDGPSNFPEHNPYQTTPHTRTARHVATDFGLRYFCAGNMMVLDQILGKFLDEKEQACLLEITTDINETLHFFKSLKNIRL
jgi:2-succinyl-5-enolpyruvyl-6-hydroxy-3-cyclohexene-1-carboxylate synthase